MGKILIDKDSGEKAINYDETKPDIDEENNTVIVKELGCNCTPGSMCGGCVDRYNLYEIGTGKRFHWKNDNQQIQPTQTPGR